MRIPDPPRPFWQAMLGAVLLRAAGMHVMAQVWLAVALGMYFLEHELDARMEDLRQTWLDLKREVEERRRG